MEVRGTLYSTDLLKWYTNIGCILVSYSGHRFFEGWYSICSGYSLADRTQKWTLAIWQVYICDLGWNPDYFLWKVCSIETNRFGEIPALSFVKMCIRLYLDSACSALLKIYGGNKSKCIRKSHKNVTSHKMSWRWIRASEWATKTTEALKLGAVTKK